MHRKWVLTSFQETMLGGLFVAMPGGGKLGYRHVAHEAAVVL
jgi:hypothetical protein